MNTLLTSNAPREVRIVSGSAEWHAVKSLRYSCFVAECGHSPAEADHENCTLGDAHDALSTVLVALDHGAVVATCRFQVDGLATSGFPDVFRLGHREAELGVGRLAFVSKLAVDARHRGSRVAVEIVSAVVQALLLQGVRHAILGCHPRLERFYRRLGCLPFGSVVVIDGVGPIQAMQLDLLNVEHLMAVGSPLHSIACEYLEHVARKAKCA